MKKILKKYESLLKYLKFREFMYVPVTIFMVLFILLMILGVREIYMQGMSCFMIFLVLFSIPLPFQLYFLVRLLQWLTAKMGLEKFYNSIFNRHSGEYMA